MSITTGTFPGVRIADMPDLGAMSDASSVVGERAGSGRFSAQAMRAYAFPSPSSIAALRGLTSGAPTIYVQGYYTAGDGGGGDYVRGAAGTDNGGTIITSANGTYHLAHAGIVSIRQFGAKLDGTTDDGPVWRNALEAALAGQFSIYHPGGVSVVTGTLALKNQDLHGRGSYYAVPGQPITQDSMIEFHGNGAGLVLADADSGDVTIEKIGFTGIPGTYTNQTGFLMDDALRPAMNEGWPTLRDVLFRDFTTGMLVGNKYQSGWMWNVYFYNSVNIGYWQRSTDWYHHGISCGSGSRIATVAQLIVGDTSATFPTYASGAHQFIGGAFFGGNETVVIGNTNQNEFIGCTIQNGNNNGVQIGNGTNAADNTRFVSCYLNGNNVSGGVRNAGGLSHYDININNSARGTTIIGCRFGDFGAGGTNGSCVAAAIGLNDNSDGTIITGGNSFNMDMIVTPGSPGNPKAIGPSSNVQLHALDYYTIEGNLARYGEGLVLPFNVLPVNLASIVEPYTQAAHLCIEAGAAVLQPVAATAFTLRDPGFAGRFLLITSETPTTGNTVTAATAGAFGSAHNVATFTAAGAYANLISISKTAWQVLNSTGVTFT